MSKKQRRYEISNTEWESVKNILPSVQEKLDVPLATIEQR